MKRNVFKALRSNASHYCIAGISTLMLVLGLTLAGCGDAGGAPTVDPLTVTASVSDGGTLSYQWYGNTTPRLTGVQPELYVNCGLPDFSISSIPG
jgi:hypothetical protein